MNQKAKNYIAEICAELDVSEDCLLSPRRGKKEIAETRHIIAYNLVYDFKLTYEQVGQLLGRHHTSILNSIYTVHLNSRLMDKAITSQGITKYMDLNNPKGNIIAIYG